MKLKEPIEAKDAKATLSKNQVDQINDHADANDQSLELMDCSLSAMQVSQIFSALKWNNNIIKLVVVRCEFIDDAAAVFQKQQSLNKRIKYDIQETPQLTVKEKPSALEYFVKSIYEFFVPVDKKKPSAPAKVATTAPDTNSTEKPPVKTQQQEDRAFSIRF